MIEWKWKMTAGINFEISIYPTYIHSFSIRHPRNYSPTPLHDIRRENRERNGERERELIGKNRGRGAGEERWWYRERQTRSPEVVPSRMDGAFHDSKPPPPPPPSPSLPFSRARKLRARGKRAATFLDCSSARGDEILKPSLSSAASCTGWKWHGKRTEREREREASGRGPRSLTGQYQWTAKLVFAWDYIYSVGSSALMFHV